MVASSSNIIVVTVAFIFFLTFLPSKSVLFLFSSSLLLAMGNAVGVVFSSVKSESSLQHKKMVLGSRPPGCVNKCLNCRPCVATISVIHSHKNKEIISREDYYSSSHEAREGGGGRGKDYDDTYYLLSWKCKCGNKLFQP